jgi:regulator of nucleoside diphosphate kinase
MYTQTLTETDFRRLSALALAVRKSTRPERARFLDERLRNLVAYGEADELIDHVTLGSSISIRDFDSGKEFKYRLVLPAEADISRGMISVLTPLGASLLGRSEGDIFSYESPGGTMRVCVDRVSRDG